MYLNNLEQNLINSFRIYFGSCSLGFMRSCFDVKAVNNQLHLIQIDVKILTYVVHIPLQRVYLFQPEF